MSDSSPEQQEFHDLLAKYIDEEISPDEAQRLAVLVKNHPEFNHQLTDQLLIDGSLAMYENSQRSAEAFCLNLESTIESEHDADDFINKVVQMSDSISSPPPPPKLPWKAAGIILAACLAVFLIVKLTSSDETLDQGVAVISSMIGELEYTDAIGEVGSSLNPGTLTLKDGYITLEFYQGAQLSAAGPVKLELIDPQHVICHYGKIRANVPKVARGFTVTTPESKIVDLGTEFAIEVGKEGSTEVHVFDGEVDAYDAQSSPKSKKRITAGGGVRIKKQKPWEDIPASEANFHELQQIEDLEINADRIRYENWQRQQATISADPRVIAYYDFQMDSSQRRTLINRALSGSELDGAIVGASWRSGPWPQKKALSFKRPGDRVRLQIPGEYESITLVTRVRIDGLDRKINSLLLTDEYDEGEIHWQIRKEGTLVAGHRYNANNGADYRSKQMIDLKNLGNWMHLTTVIDGKKGIVKHFKNGQLITKKNMADQTPIRFGDVSIGNWVPKPGAGVQIRNLNGQIAELIIYRVPLSAQEVHELYQPQSRP